MNSTCRNIAGRAPRSRARHAHSKMSMSPPATHLMLRSRTSVAPLTLGLHQRKIKTILSDRPPCIHSSLYSPMLVCGNVADTSVDLMMMMTISCRTSNPHSRKHRVWVERRRFILRTGPQNANPEGLTRAPKYRELG